MADWLGSLALLVFILGFCAFGVWGSDGFGTEYIIAGSVLWGIAAMLGVAWLVARKRATKPPDDAE